MQAQTADRLHQPAHSSAAGGSHAADILDVSHAAETRCANDEPWSFAEMTDQPATVMSKASETPMKNMQN